VVPEVEILVKRVWTNRLGPSQPDSLGTAEARARFENLMVDMITELSVTQTVILVCFFLLHIHLFVRVGLTTRVVPRRFAECGWPQSISH
jgi:hypothetical protein